VKTGRNDPCPCGSGKKYKKCCLPAAEVPEPSPAVDEAAEERAKVRQAALRSLASFAARPVFRDARTEAFRLFTGGEAADLGEGEESLEGDVEVKFAFFFMFDFPLPGGRTIAEAFLAGPGQPVAVKQQRLVQSLSGARLRPYEVMEVRRDEGLRLHDLWSGKEIPVTERAATHQLQRWDVLAARVAPEEDGTLRLEGGIYVLPIAVKATLLDALKKEERRLRRRDAALDEDRLFKHCAPLVHRLWLDQVVSRPMPIMVTAEGDPVIFGKLAFDVIDEAALRAALDRHPGVVAEEDGGYGWIEETDDFTRSLGHIQVRDDRRLVLEVTSRQRAERGRALLEAAAGAALRHRSTRFESVAKAMERSRSKPPEKPSESIPPEVAGEVIKQYKDRHYKTWPDEPLPALDGRTAREAAGIARLRPRLVDLLKEMENHEARAERPDHPAYDFGWIWRELGIERPT
jgi:hypothetical protein